VHELGIASAIIEAVHAEMGKRGEARPSRISVRIGELSAVDPEALRFAFDALVRGTDLAKLILEIQECPARYQCRACGKTFSSREWITDCPACGARDAQCVGGDELDLAYMEIENEPSGIGAQSTQ